MQAPALIDKLGLKPHPEGGWYREFYRSTERVQTLRDTRSAITTIYYLLERDQISRWHVVEADEIWHFYEGAPLELVGYEPGARALLRYVLGSTGDDHVRVAVIRKGVWQAARSLGDFSLVGCSVGPGFEFEDFSLRRQSLRASAALRRQARPLAKGQPERGCCANSSSATAGCTRRAFGFARPPLSPSVNTLPRPQPWRVREQGSFQLAASRHGGIARRVMVE
jgi:uncharacterized protein